MERKNRKKIIVINLFLFALLFGLVSLNKEFIRPLFCQISFLKILTGCFPNFIAAYIISIYFVNAVVIREPKHSRFIVYIGSFLVFVILTVEEANVGSIYILWFFWYISKWSRCFIINFDFWINCLEEKK